MHIGKRREKRKKQTRRDESHRVTMQIHVTDIRRHPPENGPECSEECPSALSSIPLLSRTHTARTFVEPRLYLVQLLSGSHRKNSTHFPTHTQIDRIYLSPNIITTGRNYASLQSREIYSCDILIVKLNIQC